MSEPYDQACVAVSVEYEYATGAMTAKCDDLREASDADLDALFAEIRDGRAHLIAVRDGVIPQPKALMTGVIS